MNRSFRPAPRPLSRRTVLRGAGTALALPWLGAMAPSARATGAPRLDGEGITRLLYMYVPNGIHMPEWTPAAEGAEFELPPILQPLAPFREQLTVLSGLTQDKARANGDGPGDHARACAAFLTGVQPLKTGGQVGLGPSADQVAARAIGNETRFRSIQLGCEAGGNSGECDSGYSCAYSNNLSWLSATTPTGKEINPALAFDRLFRGGTNPEAARAREERRSKRRSLLDYVDGEAQRLRKQLGADDRQKLEEYFDGVRELERRLERAGPAVVDSVPDAARPAGIPTAFGEHVRLMCEILALAFQTDSTRIATFLVANEGSNRSYRDLGIRDGHHSLSHHGNDAKKQEAIRDINRFHVEQLAYLVQLLSSARDAGGSLLDQTLLVYGSGIGDGNRHNHHDLPVLLLGKGAGTHGPGRHVRYPRNTPLNNLHIALLEKAGAPTPSLGDSTGVLPGV